MKKLRLFFMAVTFVNAGLFFFRDSLQYIKYATYDELYGVCDDACVQKWDDFTLAYPRTSFAEGRQILQSLHLDTGTTLSKIEAIGHHLYAKFNRQAGYPGNVIHRSAPLDDYKILSADTAQKVWCGTYAMMFAFFCWSQNVLCRCVEIYKPGDHHVLNECWVPELRQWVMVDLTNNLLQVERGNRACNAQDFVAALATPDSLAVLSAGSMDRESFAGVEQNKAVKGYYNGAFPFYYYHLTQPATVYRPVEKLKRYFLPAYWYEIFSAQSKDNLLFWAKPFFAALWLFLGCLWAIKNTKNDRSKRTKKRIR